MIAGVMLGLCYSFALYALLFTMREYIRVLCTSEFYEVWILSDAEHHFYNLFFAFVSVIFGQSLCFTIWFERSHPFLTNRKNNRVSIVHEQRFFNWSFLGWFAKVAFLYGLFFGLTFRGSYAVIMLYSEYDYLFILIVIVLFLEAWTSLLRTFKRRAYKWMIGSALLITILSIVLASVDIVDSKEVNKQLLKNNLKHKYQFELPVSKSFDGITKKSLVSFLFLVKAKAPSDFLPVLLGRTSEIEPVVLGEYVNYSLNQLPEYDKTKMIFQLCIDKDMEMKYVKQLKEELMELGIAKIAYGVYPASMDYGRSSGMDYTMGARIHVPIPGLPTTSDIIQLAEQRNQLVQIRKSGPGTWLIQGVPVARAQIQERLKTLLDNQAQTLILIQSNDTDRFQEYIYIQDQLRQAIKAVRNDYALSRYGLSYNELSYEEEKDVQDRFALRIADAEN